VLFARSADKLAELAATIEADHGVKALPVAGSILEADDIARLYATIGQEYGRLDVAVFSTGRAPTPLRATLGETEKSRWDQSYEILLGGIIELALGAVPLMAANKWGRIVAITSASVALPMPHHALSTVFRAGVEAYMQHLSGEVGADGITVNCVAPALIDAAHRSGAAAYSEEQLAQRRRMTSLNRLGTQEEVCGVIAFLTSQQAGFVTGESIRVDGGMASCLLPAS
jgi:3-oxoacyl-[acyl-carrier protein] reductase